MVERSTSHAQRVAMIERRQAGETVQQIADRMGMNYYTVRKWWRAYRDVGWEGLLPVRGRPANGALSSFDPLVRYVALKLKRQHPGWGLDKLLLAMRRRPALQGKQLPGRTALYNYLRRFYPRLTEHRRLRTRRPRVVMIRASAAHACWQMDFKGQEMIAGVGSVKVFNVCDEFSSAPLAGIIHRAEPMTFRDVQADLRRVFTDWGLPGSIRLDRDPIWIGSSRLDWPGTLLLWLVGLGVTPLVTRANRPTDNAQVERCNGIWYQQVAIGARCQSLADLQAQTDQAWRDRRQYLPSNNPHCRRKPPLAAVPQLGQPRQPYSTALEAQLFDMQRVYDYLSLWDWQRKVDPNGRISLADHGHLIGYRYRGQIVKLRFDPLTAEFVAYAVDGRQLRRLTVSAITEDYICATGGID